MDATFVSVPQATPEQPAPERLHVTPLFCGSFCTTALKLAVREIWTEEAEGLTETDIGGACAIVIVAVDVFVVSATAVAVRVTEAGAGIAAGAV